MWTRRTPRPDRSGTAYILLGMRSRKFEEPGLSQGMTGLKYADYRNLDGTGWSGYNYLVEVYGDEFHFCHRSGGIVSG